MSLAILPLAITVNAKSWLVNIIVCVIFILLILA
jgi:hypothetical protein